MDSLARHTNLNDAEAKKPAIIKIRKIYISMRAKKLQAELKSILEERERIVEALKVGVNRKTPQTKALKGRRSYLALRPGELRAELAVLQAERRELTPPKPAKTEE